APHRGRTGGRGRVSSFRVPAFSGHPAAGFRPFSPWQDRAGWRKEVMARQSPDFTFESEALASGALRIAGVDEGGRGPLAGPVTAAAVRLDAARIPAGLADSKALDAARREALFTAIMDCAEVGIAHASVAEIDSLNILRA